LRCGRHQADAKAERRFRATQLRHIELHRTSRQRIVMKPRTLPLRVRSRPVCQFCDYISTQNPLRRSFIATIIQAPIAQRQERRYGNPPHVSTRFFSTTRSTQELQPGSGRYRHWAGNPTSLKAKLEGVEKQIKDIKSSSKVEPEEVIIEVLHGLVSIASQAIARRSGRPLAKKLEIKQSSAGVILSIGNEEPDVDSAPDTTPTTNELPSPAYLSKLAEGLLKHPQVFISPNILARYVSLQRLLARPWAIPEILHLYANKEIPVLGSSPPTYKKPSPKATKSAVPHQVAHEALTAAIEVKDLGLALDMVQLTCSTPAWRRRRLMTKLGFPTVMAAIAPLALYMIAQEFSVYSNYVDPDRFRLYSFMGLSTYVLCTGTLGFVALTTHNDHHDRVVWRPGMPLLDRYAREDERAALDRIAGAWGFKEVWKRGDEEGEDWEGLRRWILLRGMVLDKADLMPGMNA
jgi:hypothetical protein